MIFEVLAFLLIGTIAGLLSGLIGIGGGLVVVPALIYLFQWMHFPTNTIPAFAIGTSLVTIIFTSLSAARTHHKKRFIEWNIIKRLVFGLSIGVVVGVLLSLMINSNLLKRFLAVFIILVATNMFLQKKSQHIEKSSVNHPLHYPNSAGFIFGLFSGLFGIGAGSTFGPYLHYNKVKFNLIVATCSILSLSGAILATVCHFLVALTIHTNIKIPFSTGYIYWPAVVCIAFTSVIFAHFGAKLSHNSSPIFLRKLFAGFLFFVAIVLLF